MSARRTITITFRPPLPYTVMFILGTCVAFWFLNALHVIVGIFLGAIYAAAGYIDPLLHPENAS